MIVSQQMKYLETAVQTASPSQLLIMLYDGAIRFCRLGMEAINKKDYEEANTNLIKCQNIIRELMVTLDRNSPLADSLNKLYDYFIHLLIQGNIKKQLEPLEEVLGYLTELKETWVQAAKEVQSGKAAVNATQAAVGAGKAGVSHG
mgnify:CR=1 FL=1